MNCQDLFYKGASGILICLQIFTTYVAFVAFFYASIQIIFSYPLSLLSNSLSKDWFSFISNMFWLFIAIPYMHLLVVINIKIIQSFFKNIWKALDLKKAENRLREYFQNPKWCDKKYRVDRWGFFYLFFVFLNLIFLVIEILGTSDQTVCSLAFAGLSCYPPIIGCIVVLIRCIPIYKSREQEIERSNENSSLTFSLYQPEDNPNFEQNKSAYIDSVNQELNEVPNEEMENDKNEVKKWQVYFDPSQIIIQHEINDFINDPEVNDYKYLSYSHKIIPSFIVTIIFIEYLIYVIYDFVAVNKIRDYFDILFFVARIAYSLLSYRFFVVFNVINYIINFKKIKENHKFIWYTYLVSALFSIVILLAVGVGLIIVFQIFKPYQLKEFQYSPIYEKNVTFSPRSSICQMKFFDFELIEYAGISSLGQTNNETIATEILKMVFNNQVYPIVAHNNPISHMYTIKYNETFSIRSFESLNDKTSVSFMLDLFMNDYVINRMSYGTIPFYYLAIDFFTYRYLYFLSMVLNRYLLMNLIHNVAYFANALYDEYDKVFFENSTIIYVGHSIGGLIAKAIGAKRNVPSVAFESLKYYHSLFQMSINMYSTTDFKSDRLKIMNVFSPSQLFSQTEETSTVNVILPKWKEIYQFTNAYETFCMVAAGCATDARYDGFCNAVIGRNNFLNLFNLWNRSRSDYLC